MTIFVYTAALRGFLLAPVEFADAALDHGRLAALAWACPLAEVSGGLGVGLRGGAEMGGGGVGVASVVGHGDWVDSFGVQGVAVEVGDGTGGGIFGCLGLWHHVLPAIGWRLVEAVCRAFSPS